MADNDPNLNASRGQEIHYNSPFEIISSFGNGTVCDGDDDLLDTSNHRMLPYQVSYDDDVNPKYPGGR